VHRAVTKDGRDVAIKVQYPGVRKSIDSDVSNVASLMRLSGLIPREIDMTPLLDEARKQLHEEADYEREGTMLARFSALLQDDPRFIVPDLHPDLTTPDILGMSFTPGVAVESLAGAPQDTRDQVMTQLIALTLRELFEFQLMQTDPNFANYRYDSDTGKIVLLDFGAARAFDAALTQKFKTLLHAGLSNDRDAIAKAAIDIGYFEADTKPHHKAQLLDMFDMAFTPLRARETFDFATNTTANQLREAGMEFGRARDFWVIPPMDTLYIQRKLAGMYLLATRLKARVDIGAILAPHL